MKTYIFNLETKKIELHFEKAEYLALSETEKKDLKSNFLWSSKAGGWVSRAIEPNLWKAKQVAKATTSMGINKFSLDAPVMIVISEKPYNATASLGAKVKNND